MLTKSEITQKRGDAVQQLPLINASSVDDKIRRKRKWVIIAIVLTIGLSIFFSFFRLVKTFLSTPQSYASIFSFSTPISSSVLDLDPQVSKIITSSNSLWDITVSANPGPPVVFNWSKNQTNLSESEISTIYNKLTQLPVTSNSIIKSYLPQGIEIKEIYLTDSQSVVLQSLIIVPNKQIVLIIRHNHPDTQVFQQQLSTLVPTLYWSIIQSTN